VASRREGVWRLSRLLLLLRRWRWVSAGSRRSGRRGRNCCWCAGGRAIGGSVGSALCVVIGTVTTAWGTEVLYEDEEWCWNWSAGG
jgi:hypothetical protein